MSDDQSFFKWYFLCAIVVVCAAAASDVVKTISGHHPDCRCESDGGAK